MWSLQNCTQQHQASARVLMLCDLEQRTANRWIAAEALRAIDKPQVELVFQRADIRHQLGVVTIGIVYQIARMHLEELREQCARRIRQVGARAALNLREI